MVAPIYVAPAGMHTDVRSRLAHRIAPPYRIVRSFEATREAAALFAEQPPVTVSGLSPFLRRHK